MAGYGETYLQGLQHLSGMVHARRQEEIAAHNEKLREENLRRQYQLMSNQEKARAIQFQIQQQNQHRLQQQGDEAQKARLTSLELRLKQMLQPHYGQPQEMVTPDNRTIQVLRDSKSADMIDPQTRRPIDPVVGATLRVPKPLPIAEKKQLEEAGAQFANHVSLLKSFKPEYAGFIAEPLGDITATARAVLPGLNTDMPNWWREQEKLSRLPTLQSGGGKALTPREIAEISRGEINKAMKPEDIISTQNRRIAIMQRGIARIAHSAAGKYNPREVEAALGMALPDNPLKSPAFPDLNELTRQGARISGVGRPPLDEIFKQPEEPQ